MPAVGREERHDVQSLGDRRDAGVNESHRSVRVDRHDFGRATDIVGDEMLDRELARGHSLKKGKLRVRPDPTLEQVRELWQHDDRYENGFVRVLPPVSHLRVPCVITVYQGVERARIGQDGHS